ncbi:PLP-dependent aminotransferase family protein [Rhodocista pekingensis]|uniref:PLP-dependent aminotransferase family protein n=1 Tax=Rhodocista pekingensis TaxID=201185 RepID=A0ABW2KPK5_9PROT
MKVSQGPLLALFDDGQGPLQHRLFERLREAIVGGALRPGERLPSTRTLARDLDVSRNTVVAAIDRLAAEGYLEARVGSGTYVARVLPDEMMTPALRLADTAGRAASSRAAAAEAVQPFRPGLPPGDLFDADGWQKLLAKRWRSSGAAMQERDGAGGWLPLRRVLAAHLQASRGIRCEADQILVLPGRTAAASLAAALLLRPGDPVWLEEPGCPRLRALMEGRGLRPVAVPVDADGLDPERGRRLLAEPRLAVVSPAWQFPLGGTMPLRRRLALLAWTQRSGAWLLEDDSDGGYRYEGRPLLSLAGLDEAGRVLHLGTLERMVAPALRVAWLVVPPALAAEAARLRTLLDLSVPVAEQMALHDFIAEGRLAAHLRRARCAAEERQQALVEAARRHWAGGIEVAPAPAGLHLLGRLDSRTGAGDRALQARAAAAGIELAALSDFHAGPAEGGGLVLGFAAHPPERIERAVARVGQLLPALTGRRAAVG